MDPEWILKPRNLGLGPSRDTAWNRSETVPGNEPRQSLILYRDSAWNSAELRPN